MPSPHLPQLAPGGGGWRTARLPPTLPPPPHTHVHHTHAHRYIPHVYTMCIPHPHAHVHPTHMCVPHMCTCTWVNHTHPHVHHTHTCVPHACAPHMHSPPCKPSCSPPSAATQPTLPDLHSSPRQPESAGASLPSKGHDHAGHLLWAPLNQEQIPHPMAAGPAVHTPPCSPLAALRPPSCPSICLTLLQPTPAAPLGGAAAPLGGAVCSPASSTPPATLPHPQSGSCQHFGVHLFITVASAPIPPLPTRMQPGSREGPLGTGKGQRVPLWVFSTFHVSVSPPPGASDCPGAPEPPGASALTKQRSAGTSPTRPKQHMGRGWPFPAVSEC